jgi:hypothetical protein
MITAWTALITVALVILIFLLPRKWMLVPFVVAACFVPAEQHALVLSLHFYVGRILVVAGILRILVRGETRGIRWNRFDKVLVAWAVYESIAYILLHGDFQSVIWRSGQMLEILGLYWIARQTIRTWEDMRRLVKLFALSAIIIVPFVALEWMTGRNPFSILGRVGTPIREGAYRCQASFPHAIIGGAFWVCLAPLFIGVAKKERGKLLCWIAVGAVFFLTMASHSSTPVGGLGVALFFMVVYRYRCYGRYMAMAFFGTLLGLHMVMKAPVWALLARVTIIAGSTGYHRYLLIDGAVRHFKEWALLGTLSTADWGYYLFDVTNQYILEGVRGGFLTLVLFVAILVMAIRATAQYSLRDVPDDQKWLSWGICTSILTHCVMFIGVGYFGQILMLLYLTFGFSGLIYEWNSQPVVPVVVRRRQELPGSALSSGRAVAIP